MRAKLNPNDKRSIIIGIKVTPKTRKQVQYLAEREAEKMSTYIAKLVEQRIEQFTRDTKTDWEQIFKELEEEEVT